MTGAVPILRVQCFQCSKFCHPKEVIRTGESVIRCWDCFNKHTVSIQSFAEPPTHCALCNTPFAKLIEANPSQPVSMFMHWIDGGYGLLCKPCDKDYVLKRADLYGNTRHGYERGIR